MTLKEFQRAKDIYERCVLNGTLIPEELREAYWIITGREKDEPIVPIRKCKLIIFNFFQHQAADVLSELTDLMTDKTDTNLPDDSNTMSIDNENQSHTEDVLYQGISHTGSTETHIDDTELSDEEQIEELRKQYKDAHANVKRSITMRIKAIEKRMNNE